MNAMTRLLADLDQVFGFKDKKKSTYRKVSQVFDERTNEHVIMIEYRVRRGGDGVVSRRIREDSLLHGLLCQKKSVHKN